MKLSFMLAKIYFEGMTFPKSATGPEPPEDWYASEKFDGFRSRYDSKKKKFISRQNKGFEGVPEWFKMAMPPNVNLDGELWVGRDCFEKMGIVRRKDPDCKEWIPVKFIVYDLPDLELPFEERIKSLEKIVKNNKVRWNILREKLPEPFNTLECPLIFAKQTKIKSEEHLNQLYNNVLQKNGEGLILKNPKSFYEDKRSNNMLKFKPDFDEEAIIVDYKLGNGKYTGLLGGFVCKPLINMGSYQIIDTKEPHEFTTSGMDDEVRINYKETHPIGTIITYTHNGKTKIGKPRFARYMRKRDDVTIKDKIDTVSHQKRDRIISIFQELHIYEKTNGETFKANSYKKAITGIKQIKSDVDLTEQNIKSIKGVGNSLYEKINDIIKTDTCTLYEKIKNIDDPRKLFLDIHGIGNVKANELVEKGIKTIQELRDNTELLNDIQKLGLKHYEDLLKRIPRNEIVLHEKILKDLLSKVDQDAELTIAGSYRRNKDESGDIDVLLKSGNKKTYHELIKALTSEGYLIEHLAKGNKKYNGISKVGENGIGRRIDIMYTTPSEYPFAILYFTGSDDFNKRMRKLILEKDLTINEYSLKNKTTKQKVDHNFKEEKDIFDYLGMDYVEPWDRV